jgi:Flp pilus assembly pilin Flp
MTIEQQIFTPAEVEAFRADDRSAATAIVGLMAGIFTLGLIGYLGVCYWVG